jgi:hypothetical protein
LAQTYAHAIYQYARGEDVPLWVKLFDPAILEEMGELDKARTMLQESMERGLVKSPDDVSEPPKVDRQASSRKKMISALVFGFSSIYVRFGEGLRTSERGRKTTI